MMATTNGRIISNNHLHLETAGIVEVAGNRRIVEVAGNRRDEEIINRIMFMPGSIG